MTPLLKKTLASGWVWLLLAGCGPYADWRLGSPGPAEPGTYRWKEHPAPVMSRGAANAWDGVDTLNPSIVARDGFWNLYSGYDGRVWRTGIARSTDGYVWERKGEILAPDSATWEGTYIAANGAAIFWNNEWLYYYQAGNPPRIGLARSADGTHWTKSAQPVLDLGPRGSWDERGAADPYAVVLDGQLCLYYLGEDRARQQKLGVAASQDGIRWTKLRTNPILEPGEPGSMDERGLGEPAVWAAHGSYWMLYTGRARNEVRRLALAQSKDGVTWTRTPLVISGAFAWDAKVICDPTVEVSGHRVRVWFGGGDVAHPAENINGQIGYGELTWSASLSSEPAAAR